MLLRSPMMALSRRMRLLTASPTTQRSSQHKIRMRPKTRTNRRIHPNRMQRSHLMQIQTRPSKMKQRTQHPNPNKIPLSHLMQIQARPSKMKQRAQSLQVQRTRKDSSPARVQQTMASLHIPLRPQKPPQSRKIIISQMTKQRRQCHQKTLQQQQQHQHQQASALTKMTTTTPSLGCLNMHPKLK